MCCGEGFEMANGTTNGTAVRIRIPPAQFLVDLVLAGLVFGAIRFVMKRIT